MSRIVTITTDFGTADGYVGEMKGVLLAHAPGATLVDITHDIPPQDVEFARITVARFWRRFPPGTMHVSSSTRASARRAPRSQWRATSVFSWAPTMACSPPHCCTTARPRSSFAFATTRQPRFTAATFSLRRGRSRARRRSGDARIDPPESCTVLRTPEPVHRSGGVLEGQIVAIDRFGNAITNLSADGGGAVIVGKRAIPLRRTYADVEIGEALAVVGSSGSIEIAIRNGNAARALYLSRGDKIILHAEP